MKKMTLSLLLLCTVFASARATEFSAKNISNILENQEVENILDEAFMSDSKGAMAGLTIATAGAASMSLGYVFYKKLKAIDPDTTDPILLKKRKQFLALAWIFGLGGGVVTATGVGAGFYGDSEKPVELNEENFDGTFEEDSTEEVTDDESGKTKKKKRLKLKNPLKKKKKQESDTETSADETEKDSE